MRWFNILILGKDNTFSIELDLLVNATIMSLKLFWESKVYKLNVLKFCSNSGFQLPQLVKSLIVEYEIYGSIPIYTKNRLVFKVDDKEYNH